MSQNNDDDNDNGIGTRPYTGLEATMKASENKIMRQNKKILRILRAHRKQIRKINKQLDISDDNDGDDNNPPGVPDDLDDD